MVYKMNVEENNKPESSLELRVRAFMDGENITAYTMVNGIIFEVDIRLFCMYRLY